MRLPAKREYYQISRTIFKVVNGLHAHTTYYIFVYNYAHGSFKLHGNASEIAALRGKLLSALPHIISGGGGAPLQLVTVVFKGNK